MTEDQKFVVYGGLVCFIILVCGLTFDKTVDKETGWWIGVPVSSFLVVTTMISLVFR